MEIALPNHADGRVIQEAARSGNVDLVSQLLVENPVLLWTKTVEAGHTLLHLASINGHEDLARLLLRKGADPEEADNDGWKPLASTAMGGIPMLGLAQLLLEFGANVDSVNVQYRHSALHICADQGFTRLGEILLEHHAQVDLEDIRGQTPLERAIQKRKTAMVRLLLRHGAARRASRSHMLRSAPLHNRDNSRADEEEIGRLLESSHLLEGPTISRVNTGHFRRPQNVLARSPAPLDDRAKMMACQSFEATIIDFFVDEKEQRIEESASVYSILYGKGANAIMGAAHAENGIDRKQSFRWYHLPANNMEWVEALVRRHFSERESGMTHYNETVAVDLGIQRTQRAHHLIPTTMGSFIRPYSCKVKNTQSSMQSQDYRLNRYIGAFVPYLHFELQKDFEAMTRAVHMATSSWMEQPPIDITGRRAAPPRNRQHYHPNDPNAAGTTRDDPLPQNANAASPRQIKLERGLPHKILIDGYSQPDFAKTELAVPPLQHRRTLDHYLYSHLASMAKRDRDQVIQKFTSKFALESKMFMVDQLWLWILDDDTVISCSSLRWDAWDIIADFDAEIDPDADGHDRGASERFVLRDDDPLNMHQATLNYLKKGGRPSINDVESLCRVILSSCLSSFDYNETPGEYHFFDFFEHAIGNVMDQTAERFQNFRSLLGAAAQRNELLSAVEIRFETETWLLGEIEDIRDELGILRRVLEDQRDVAKDLETHLQSGSSQSEDQSEADSSADTHLRGSRVLLHHLKRIDKMEVLTARCIENIRSLLTLKQQHASLSEAHSSRKQAEYTSKQAEESVFYNRSVAEQLELARKQADETSRQGNMSLLFTVVAAVFLPLSFITSFFTIELDGFPYNSDGKLPLDIVVAIIMSVSAGVSIPFVLIAFNFDRVKTWWAILVKYTKRMKRTAALAAFLLAALLVSLAVVLSQPLGAAVKTGAAVAIVLATLAALGFLIVSYYGPVWAKMQKR